VQILRKPSTELGPLPAARAKAGRMNRENQPVFYGAFAPATAIAEVRPWVGSFVTVGEFRATRPLRLLDLRRLGHSHEGSIFAADFEKRINRLRFLRQFQSRIVRPVAPDAEAWAYRSTQAVAAYVATEVGFDGILYASVQVGAAPGDPDDPYGPFGGDEDGLLTWPVDDDEIGQHNVVLFGAAGRVQEPRRTRRGGSGIRYVDGTVSVERVMGLQVMTERAYIFAPAEFPIVATGRSRAVEDVGFNF